MTFVPNVKLMNTLLSIPDNNAHCVALISERRQRKPENKNIGAFELWC